MTDRVSTKPKKFCFVLMPFHKSFDDVYEFGIKGACNDAGIYCERVDEQVFVGSMLDRIYNQISRADLLVADMSGKNPNVFYEVGYAHALGKNVVLLTNAAEDIPFDLKHFPHIVYGTEIKTLRASLTKTLSRIALDEPERRDTQVGLELYLKSSRLSDGSAIAEFSPDRLPGAELTIANNSSVTYPPGDFRIGIVAPAPFNITHSTHTEVTPLPDGTFLHMLHEFNTLFPGAYTRQTFYLASTEKNFPQDFTVQVRVFSSAGLRDFPLRLRRVEA